MTSSDVRVVLNEFITLYPNVYRGYDQNQLLKVAKGWERLYGNEVRDMGAFIEALYEYNKQSDYPNPPTAKQWLGMYRTVKARRDAKDGRNTRRIITEDEELYNLYLAEMKKPPAKRNEFLIRNCLPSAKIMTDPEAYRRKYGKSREEYERYQ